MVCMPNIPFWERVSSMIFVFTYLINPFLLFSLVLWIVTVSRVHGNESYYILTLFVVAVVLYKLSVPVWCRMNLWETAAFYIFFLTYIVFGPFIGIMVLCYSIYNMDDFGWGKTRTVIDVASLTTALVSHVLGENAK